MLGVRRVIHCGKSESRKALDLFHDLRLCSHTTHRAQPRHPDDPRRRVAPSASRNKGPILEVLRLHLKRRETDATAPKILEIASGTGEHIAHYAAAFPSFSWQPSEWCGHSGLEFDAHEVQDIHESISAWTEGIPNVLPPIALDASAPNWPAVVEACPGGFSGIVASNVTHIAPWDVTVGLISGAGRILRAGGHLFVYGPFLVNQETTAEGNVFFDRELRTVSPSWGLREMSNIIDLANNNGLHITDVEIMPANNRMLVFKKW